MSLFQEIKDSAEGRELSIKWYQRKIKSLGADRYSATQHIMQGSKEGRVVSRPEFGMLNLFYYEPKGASKLKYYDIYPIVLPFESHRNGFTGINFHFLPIPLRIELLERLQLYSRGDTLEVYWDLIAEWRSVQPIVRRYLKQQVKSLFLRLPLDDMLVGSLLPVQGFYKGDWNYKQRVPNRIVWRDTRRRIMGEQ
jgi:hypothetical protein